METTLPPVFEQLEAAVTALPMEYRGKDKYKVWIETAKAKYANRSFSDPTEVDTFIKTLKAAGTALREKGDGDVPGVLKAPAETKAAAVAEAAKDEAAKVEAAGSAAGSAAPEAEAEADKAAAPAAAPEAEAEADKAAAPAAAGQAEAAPAAAKTAAQDELSNASEALSAAQPGPEQDAARERLAAAKKALGLPEGGRSRKTRHRTPKRKKLSRKKSVKRK